jgi:hypothetical protein
MSEETPTITVAEAAARLGVTNRPDASIWLARHLDIVVLDGVRYVFSDNGPQSGVPKDWRREP